MKKKTSLYIHAGHNKTGSSYLQQFFLLNHEKLEKEYGVAYPLAPAMLKCRQENKVTSGNGAILYKSAGCWRRKKVCKHLFSREQFFKELLSEEKSRLLDTLLESEVDEIHILLFVRDPLDYAISDYQQLVRGQGFRKSIDQFVQGYSLKKVSDFINHFLCRPNVHLTVHNYSNERERLIELVLLWLGVDENKNAFHIPTLPVNRGFTLGEYHIQRGINKVLGKQISHLFYRDVVEKYPFAIPAKILPNEDVQKDFFARNEVYISEINSILPHGQHYAATVQSPSSAEITFTAEQLEVVGEAVGRMVYKAAKYEKFKGIESKLYWLPQWMMVRIKKIARHVFNK